MAKHDYFLARQQTRQFLRETGVDHHMFYGPTSDAYWSAPWRILAVNLEPYGYEDCGHVDVDLDCLLGWMYGGADKRSKTVRYTLAIVKTLTDALDSNIPPCPQHFCTAYADAPSLEATLRRIAYYNIRPTSNPEKPEDAASIVASGSTALSAFVRDEMLALAPHVILVSGHSGLSAFNAMWRLNPPLPYLTAMRHSCGAVIQSVRHPSRPNYSSFATTLSNALRQLNSA